MQNRRAKHVITSSNYRYYQRSALSVFVFLITQLNTCLFDKIRSLSCLAKIFLALSRDRRSLFALQFILL